MLFYNVSIHISLRALLLIMFMSSWFDYRFPVRQKVPSFVMKGELAYGYWTLGAGLSYTLRNLFFEYPWGTNIYLIRKKMSQALSSYLPECIPYEPQVSIPPLIPCANFFRGNSHLLNPKVHVRALRQRNTPGSAFHLNRRLVAPPLIPG